MLRKAYELTRSQKLFVFCAAVFITALVVAEATAGKFFTAFDLPAGIVIFGVTFNEVIMTAGRMLWLRATGSTLGSQFIDTFVVLGVAFWGQLRFQEILAITLYQLRLQVYHCRRDYADHLSGALGHGPVSGPWGQRPISGGRRCHDSRAA